MPTTLPEDRVDAEFRDRLKELTETMRYAVVLLEHLTRDFPESKSKKRPHQVDRPLPDLAKVKVVGREGPAAEVMGETGVVLSRDGDLSSGWLYTVLIDSTKETYMLPHHSLQFEQEVAQESGLYTSTAVAVSVDETGAGHVVRKSRRSKSRG
jgi:hypothetical protein